MKLYVKAEPVREMKKAYVRERFGELTAKEIAARLEVSQEFVYDTLRSTETEGETTLSLFEDASGQ